MLNLSEVLNRNGLQSWSRVSEDTRDNLSQVPWIREKVESQDKDAQALQGTGSWAAGENRFTDGPDSSALQDDDAGSNSIDLEAEIDVPEFSLRMIGRNEPPKRPIGEVLDDVRRSLSAIKDEIRNTHRAAPDSADLNKETLSQLGRSSIQTLSQFLNDTSIQPWAAPSNTEASSKKPPPAPELQDVPKAEHTEAPLPQLKHPRSWVPSHLAPKQHRHDSLDSQKCELQLFPAKMSTEENWKRIRRGLPRSIRNQCVFKDNYWWYDGDLANLSGLTRDNNSLGLGPGIGDPTNPSHPVIQKGSITIAGRPLLIERCFVHHKSSAAWTCRPNQPDFSMMTDAPIPVAKDGDPVVVPLAPIEVSPRMVWDKADPLGDKNINPRSFSEDDLKEIARVLWPREFCLYLDGNLQVMVSKRDLLKIKKFPERIGGLSVSFSNCVASSSQSPPSRSRILLLARSAVEELAQRSRGRYKTRAANQSSSRAIQAPEEHATAPSASSRSVSTGSGGTSGAQVSTDMSAPSSARGGSPSRASPPPNLQQPSQGAPPIRDPLPANPQQQSQGGPSGALTGPAGITSDVPATVVVSAPPVLPPTTIPYIPCEVIIGEIPDLGVSCYVGVKIRDGETEKITVPTSAALEAASKARRASGTVKRAKGFLLGDRTISVIGLGVWTRSKPHKKIGTIRHCYDHQDGRTSTMHSVHPDDLLYDVCLVEGEGDNPFAAITSPCTQWWVKAKQTEPGWIVENTLLHIACPAGLRDDALAVDGRKLSAFAQDLPPVNAVYQGVRVVPQGQPYITEPGRGLLPGSKRLIPKIVLGTSTLYRFMGPIESLEGCRGAAVVEVNKDTRQWESVVGLHSFEYLIKAKGSSESDPTWGHFEKGLLAGALSFWGCRYLPPELTGMPLV
ncbi:MAG: hypothetical protein M1839_001745 [Geoglossum umbratile]|nr:MAG: hypothetical protein M1839_001745 [Geoglossum umbratile]